MAILGYNTQGSSASFGFAADRFLATKFTLGSASTLLELHCWYAGTGSSITLSIYDDAAGSPNNRLAYTAPITNTGAAADRSQTGFSVPLAAGDYWIAWGCVVVGTGGIIYSETTGAVHQGYNSATPGGVNPPPNPFGTPTASGTRKFSVWAVTGTAAGAAFVPQIVIT